MTTIKAATALENQTTRSVDTTNLALHASTAVAINAIAITPLASLSDPET